MQDGQLSNTPFEQQLNQSDWGKFLPGTGVLNPEGPAPKTNTQINYDQLRQSLMAEGDAVTKSAKGITSPYKEELVPTSALDLSGRFKRQLYGADNEDLWGQSQSNWDKMFNGITKGLSLAGTTFLQGTAGLAYGIGQVISGHGFNSLYNNDFSNALNDFNNSLENKLPNYYTARERSADWWEPANLLTANFLWDKLVKNLGFSVGAIYSGAVTARLLSLIPEAFALSKAGVLGNVAENMEQTLTALPPLQRAAGATNTILSASKTVNTLNKIVSPIDRFVISTLGAVTEGGIEALQGVNQWRDQKIQEYKDTYNTLPDQEALAKINDYATDLGNARFGMNMALLTATNYVQLPRILSSSYQNSKIIANGVERSVNPIARNLETGLFETAKRSIPSKLISRAANISGLFFSPTEAFEEGAQNTIQEGVEDYYNKAYRGDGRDWVNSLSVGGWKTLHDKSGLEQILIGGLSGGLQQAGFVGTYQNEQGKTRLGLAKSGELGERGFTGEGGEKGKHTEDLLASLNKSKATLSADGWMEAMAKSASRGINLQIDGQNYIRHGDVLEAKDNEFDYQHNYLTPRIQYGRMDLVTADINNYREMAATPEGWNKLKETGLANENDTKQSFLSRLEGLEKHAKAVNSLYQSLNVRYGGLVNTKTKQPVYDDVAMEKMVYAASKVSNYDERIPQVNQSLATAGISTQPIIDNIIANNRVPESATKDALNQINNLDVISSTKDQLKSDLRDVIEMSLRRKNFLKAYDQLKENPEKYSPVVEPDVNGSTNIGGKQVEIGKEYNLAQPLFREGNKLSISPTLTVLSSTLRGELEVKTPTGEITYRKPKDVNYDLADTNVTSKEYNNTAEKAIDKVIGKKEGIETLQQKLDYVNSQNNKDLTDNVEEQIVNDTKELVERQKKAAAENEKLKKNEALNKKLDEEQAGVSQTVETKDNPTPEDEARVNINPKAPLPTFLSKEADFYDEKNPKPHQQRRLKFLSAFPSMTQGKIAKINVIAVTRNNEDSYGLKGLIDWVVDDIKNTKMSDENKAKYIDEKGNIRPEHEPIIKLYVTKEGNKLHIVTPEGKVGGELIGGADNVKELTTTGVFGAFHSNLTGAYTFSENEGERNWSGQYTQEEFNALVAQHNAWREAILKAKDSPVYPIKTVSRGVVLRDEENKPVTETSLATEEDLKTKEKLITIPTIEGYTVGDVSYKFTPGIPLLTNGSNVDFLNNRTFTETEAENIFKLLRYRVEHSNTQEAKRVEAYLSSILYLRSPRANEAISESQIYHQRSLEGRQYHFGTQMAVDFNVHAMDASKDDIISYLKNYFVKTNNKILTEASSLGFEEAIPKEDGTVEYKQHPSYQYYMLSSEANKTPFLQTKARKSVSEEDPAIIHRYTTLQSSEFAFAAKPKPAASPKEQAPKAQKTPVTGAPKKVSFFGNKTTEKEATAATETKGEAVPPKGTSFFGKKASTKTIEAQKADIESRRKTAFDTFSLEKQKEGLYYEYYITPEGETEAVHGPNEEAVRNAINKKYDDELAALENTPATTKEKIDKFKGKDPSIGKEEFSIIDNTINYSPIDIQKELAGIKARSPFDVEILHHVISVSDGVFAWGQFKGMLVSLYDKAKEGTGYHELFEGVWKVFTTQAQKQAIYDDFKSREGNFTSFDGKEYSSVPHAEAGEWQIKEALANEFADYMRTKELPKGNTIARWFQNLWELIKSIFNGKIGAIDTIFRKINAGAYKSASPIYTDENTEYSFKDLDYVDQYSTIRGVALAAVSQAINPNNKDAASLTEWEESDIPIKEIYNRVYDRLREIYEEDIYTDKLGINKNLDLLKTYENYWENLKENWQQVIDATNEYLRSAALVAGVENEDGELEAIDRETTSNRDYAYDSMSLMNDARNTASRSVKLLFLTLPETVFNQGLMQSARTASTLMEQQVNYAKTFNSLLAQLEDYNTYDEKMAKLEDLSQKFPNFKRLYTRLTTPSNTANKDSVLNDWKLKVRFYQVMAKQSPTPWIQYNQKNGTSFTKTANLESSKKLLVQSWIDTMKTKALDNKSELYSTNNRGELTINTSKLKFAISTPEERTSFLEQLGINFTREMYDTLSTRRKGQEKSDAENFNDAVAGLAHSLKNKGLLVLENAKGLNAINRLETIADSSIRAGSDFESTFFNIEKERQSTFVLTNAVSRMVNSLNNSETLDELFKVMPQLADVKDSIYLDSILYNKDFGHKTTSKIDVGYIQGTVDSKGKPIPGSKLTFANRMVQEINQNLSHRYYILVPADGKTQWLATMKNIVSYQNVATNSNDYQNRVKGLFVKYYETEKAEYEALKNTLSSKELESRMGVFRIVSNNYTMSSENMFKEIGDFFNREIDIQRRELERYGILAQSRKAKGNIEWKGLDGEFATANSLNPKSLESQTVDDILRFRTLNFAINNIEMHKMFFGSALAYKDAKRWKLFLSPREISMYDSKEYNDFLNEHFNHNDRPNNLTGKWTFSDWIPTVMMHDVTVVNEALSKLSPKYREIVSTDAQAWSTLVAMRERRLKSGSWKATDEEQFQYTQAQDRQAMLLDGVLQQRDEKADDFYPKELANKDRALVAEGNPNSSYIYVEKPILSGHVQNNGVWTPITDKYSIVSMSYAAIRDTNFREHYIKMMKQGIGYLVAESGRKIGKTEPNSFYTPEGDVNLEPYKGITPVPFSAFGVQTDTSNKKESQIRGSQITKLIIVNLHDNGVPISEKAGQLAKDNIELLKAQTDVGYQKLLTRIGAVEQDGQYRIIDKTKVVGMLKNELLNREVADSIKALVATKEGKPTELEVPFESLPNYTQIKNILYSFVDKYVIRPRVNGSPKVQVSGALMEKYGVKKTSVNDRDAYYSSSLHFYSKEEPWIDVMLPVQAADRLRKAGIKWENTEELYDLFKNSPDSKEILSAIGFRIPTQDLNSTENMRIAGFLPEEFGDTIVVPEEIVTKAGSDFDIDKLNCYIKNLYIDSKKQLRVVPYFGIGEEARQKLKDWLSKDVAEDWLMNEKSLNPADFESYEEYSDANAAVNKMSEEDLRTSEEKAAATFERIYAQSIENEYYKNMSEIMSLPENFERMITPNSADTLKDTRDQLIELSEVFDNTLNPSIISPSFMLKSRHDGLSLKDLVGIAAVAQTGIASAQLSSIVIDPKNIPNLGRMKNYLKNNGQPLLPHNSINGKATISSVKDVEGHYISDNNSEILTGTVDAFNDPFLSQINYNIRTAAMFHLMVRLGMPNSKAHPIITMFMNQPIVRKYLGLLDRKGVDGLFDRNAISQIRNAYKYKGVKPAFPKGLSELTEMLKDNIRTVYGNGMELTNIQKSQQDLVFHEFLKYAALANQLFQFQQGSNWDTAKLNDPNSAYFKNYQLENAIDKNVFSDINSYLANTHIGKQRDAVMAANSTLSDILIVQNEATQRALEPLLSRIASLYKGAEIKKNIARKMEESLLNFLIETKTGINNSLHYMMVDAQTALVNQLKAIKKAVPDNDVIWKNLVLQQLIPSIKGYYANSTKNITLAVKPRDVAAKNAYNNAFQQLWDNDKTSDLARSLVKISFLQNGVSNSRISFKDAIPAKIYSNVVNTIMDALVDEDSVNKFVNSDAFYRNNWNDENIVPVVYESDEADGSYQLREYPKMLRYIDKLKSEGEILASAKGPNVLMVPLGDSKAYSKFLTHIYQQENADGTTTTVKRLFQRLEIGTAPITESMEEDQTGAVFVQVSALGDADRAQEYYETPHSSVFNNGYSNPDVDLNINRMIDYITGDNYAENENMVKESASASNKITPNTFLNTFDFGSKEGTPQNSHTDDIVHKNIINNPSKPMYDEGESFNEAFERVIGGLKAHLLTLPANTLLVTHNSVYGLIKLWNDLGRPKEFSKEDRIAYTKQDNKFPTGSHFVISGTNGDVIVSRHGETEDNNRKVYRTAEAQLNDVGVKQAEKLGEELSSAPLSRIVSSTIPRALSTASIILGKQGAIKQEQKTSTPIGTAPKQITEVTRGKKRENYTITLANGTKEERSGYRLTVKEYPNFQGFITGDSKTGWHIDELVTGNNIPVRSGTIKEILPELASILNRALANPTNKELLKQTGLTAEPGTENKC